MYNMKEDALKIISDSIEAVKPEACVKRALRDFSHEGNIFVLAIGKAAWRMAYAAQKSLKGKITQGIVITKYQHSAGPIKSFEVYEAGHPISDENTVLATKKALEMTEKLTKNDLLLFLVSGGGSALFELPAPGVSLTELMAVNNSLIRSGADIVEINTVRKHISSVKGGRFAKLISPAKIFSLVLSDVVGDRLDSIASGPAYPDSSTSQEASEILKKYRIDLSENALQAVQKETPKVLDNVSSQIIGNVKLLCESAAKSAKKLGYTPKILSWSVGCEASQIADMLCCIARDSDLSDFSFKKPYALILGGEPVVNVTGNGLGGRNQELVLRAAIKIKGLENTVVSSVGSDGTDGPTDAAGGLADGNSFNEMVNCGIDPAAYLKNNDSYHALEKSGLLVKTGPTGTNVNDLIILLHR
ncbi:MAG: glycerate kinase [Petrotogaceae bacterium]|jgi:hydroxypyruvate reductase|nr:glycerate kinase [Petrotogaceae bacterium]